MRMETGTVTIEDIASILASINDFDPAIIASLMSGYLLMFVLGYGASTVIKLMKKV
jgi:hypothetical protein